MKGIRQAGLLLVVLGSLLHAQNAPRTSYAESFRHGPTQITEDTLEVKLDPQNAQYRSRIKDSRGADRYLFTITPQGPEGDSSITSWRVQLKDLRHAIYNNVLVTTQDSGNDAKNDLGWLNPGKYAVVPINAMRIMKVDNFYVVLQVTAYHFTPVDSPYLDSMTVEARFTNSDPRGVSP